MSVCSVSRPISCRPFLMFFIARSYNTLSGATELSASVDASFLDCFVRFFDLESCPAAGKASRSATAVVQANRVRRKHHLTILNEGCRGPTGLGIPQKVPTDSWPNRHLSIA